MLATDQSEEALTLRAKLDRGVQEFKDRGLVMEIPAEWEIELQSALI